MDPVRSFERWKKKYTRRTKRLRLQRKERERPEWQVEREGISRLVQQYPQVRHRELCPDGGKGCEGKGGLLRGGGGCRSTPVAREWELYVAYGVRAVCDRALCRQKGSSLPRGASMPPPGRGEGGNAAPWGGWGQRVGQSTVRRRRRPKQMVGMVVKSGTCPF